MAEVTAAGFGAADVGAAGLGAAGLGAAGLGAGEREASVLTLTGDWPLTAVLADLCASLGLRLTVTSGSAAPALRCRPAGRAIPLPTGAALRRAIIETALMSLAQCVEPFPAACEGTVLVPASGLSGPAHHGPIDAIIDAGLIRASREESGLRLAVRLLQVQHTRCWAASLAFSADHPVFRPAGPVRVLPDAASLDTARATQFMLEAGGGYYWPDVALAGRPEPGPGSRIELLALFTEGHYLRQLTATWLREAETVMAACE